MGWLGSLVSSFNLPIDCSESEVPFCKVLQQKEDYFKMRINHPYFLAITLDFYICGKVSSNFEEKRIKPNSLQSDIYRHYIYIPYLILCFLVDYDGEPQE